MEKQAVACPCGVHAAFWVVGCRRHEGRKALAYIGLWQYEIMYQRKLIKKYYKLIEHEMSESIKRTYLYSQHNARK